jgi:anti-sigma regulatory factor (Ser/Thr protein kinase)/putative methionine-R-sulfoxide reductase with GAF domain
LTRDTVEHHELRQQVVQLRALQRVTDAALAYLSLDQLLIELLERVSEILGTDTAAFLLIDESERELVARAAKGIEEEVEQGVRIPVGRGFAGRIAATRQPVFIPDVDHADILNPILREKGIRSMLGVPLLVEGRVIGVMHVGSLTPRVFTDADRELMQLAGDRAAVAIERAQLYHQRGVVEALQHSLVPGELPLVPGLTFAASYQPATVRGGIGGDWYDVFALPRGGVALVVGDVMGHGIAAAALMAQIRTGLRAYALDGHSPAGVVERLNRLANAIAPRQMITLVYVALDLASESMLVASAGHIPPLLRLHSGDTRLLEVEGDPPLGALQTAHYTEHRIEFPLGSTLVLVTDGAVEVRGESLDDSLERLRALVSSTDNPDVACEAIAGGDVRGVPAGDDVAVLIARAAPLSTHLHTTWPANARVLGDMRPLLRRWLGHWGADADEIYDITVAVQEASANAIEHAYAPGRAAFEVNAVHDDGEIIFTIRDRGRWRAPRGNNRGRGLPMMRALMDDVDVQQDETGTRVTLRRKLGRIAA